MARCETCGNDYDKAFQVSMNGSTRTFDSFECAIHALAPKCKTCGIHIMGHGLEKEGIFFCCEHCAERAGVTGLRDRIGTAELFRPREAHRAPCHQTTPSVA